MIGRWWCWCFADGHVENRLFTPPPGQTPSSMREAANFLNALIEGRTLSEVRTQIADQIHGAAQEIDTCSRTEMVESGLAVWDRCRSDSSQFDRAWACESIG